MASAPAHTPPPAGNNSGKQTVVDYIKTGFWIFLGFVIILLLQRGCELSKSSEDVKSSSYENCNVLRLSEMISGPTFVEFNYKFSIETQGDGLWFQFPGTDGKMMPPVLWTGKGTYEAFDRTKGRGAGPVKVWPADSQKSVWLKIYEVKKC